MATLSEPRIFAGETSPCPTHRPATMKLSNDRALHAPRRAFTLVEILIVIAVIALLAAILFPVFARARENARRTSCASNLKQLALGMIQYAQDNDEQLPPDQPNPVIQFDYPTMAPRASSPSCATLDTCLTWNWADLIYPYVKNSQVYNDPVDTNDYYDGCKTPSGGNCSLPLGTPKRAFIYQGPTELVLKTTTDPATPIGGRGNISYGYFYPSGYSSSPKLGIPLSMFAYPSEKSMLAEGLNYSISNYTTLITRHFDGVNCAFVDGHVKWMKWYDIENKSSPATDYGKHFWFLNGVDF